MEEITRALALGLLDQAEMLISFRMGKRAQTTFIKLLNGTFLPLARLIRKIRNAASRIQTLHTGMYLIGGIRNFY